jgi:hypothetical protein
LKLACVVSGNLTRTRLAAPVACPYKAGTGRIDR